MAKLSTSYGVWRMQSIIFDEMYLSWGPNIYCLKTYGLGSLVEKNF
jgi:hypothetical protein